MRRGARHIGTIVITLVVMGRLPAAAADAVAVGSVEAAAAGSVEAAIQRGWWNAARRDSTGGTDVDRAMIDRLEDEATRAAAARHAWLRDSRDWTIRWSRPLAPRRRADDTGGLVAPPAVAGPIIAWNASGAVHAVMADSGAAAWQTTATPDTTLFPRLGPRTAAAAPHAVATAGHLLFAVVQADGPLLVCLDCSRTAEGRLAWTASPPAGNATFDGPPAADAELCAVVCRTADDRQGLWLLACDARDGRPLWRRPLGTGLARDGRDYGRGMREPLLHDGMVVVADHAGSVTAFTRDGQPLWKHAYDATSAAPSPHTAPREHAALAAARDTLLAAPLDRGGLIAIDLARSPRTRWETPAGVPTSIIGSTPDRVVIAAGQQPRLESRSVAEGTISAGESGGSAILVGDVVLQSARSTGGVEITPRDITSLAALGPAFPLPVGRETQVALAAGHGALVVAAPDMLFCIAGRPTPRPSSP